MREKHSMRVVEAGGSAYKLGFEIGSQCQDLAREMVEDCCRGLKQKYNIDWDRARVIAQKPLSFCEDSIPKYVDELKGYAEGASLELEEVFTLFYYYSSKPAGGFGCTDLVVSAGLTKEKHVFMAHNEDTPPKERKYLCLVRGKPEGAPAFLTVTYGGVIFNAGLNSAGLGFGGNALNPNDTRVGIPVDLVFRAMYGAGTMVEALTYANLPHRESSYNNIVADNQGQIYNIEGSATDFELTYAGGSYLVHSNHYVTEKMKKYESDFRYDIQKIKHYMCSVARFNRMSNLVLDSEEISVPGIMAMMRDHANYPYSICCHVDEEATVEDQYQTNFSSIVDLTAQELWLCYGNPCFAEYERYTL